MKDKHYHYYVKIRDTKNNHSSLFTESLKKLSKTAIQELAKIVQDELKVEAIVIDFIYEIECDCEAKDEG